MERAPGGDRSLVGARPVRDWGETSDRTVLHHEVEILGEALDDAVALRETHAALEPKIAPGLVQRPHAVRDPVVLLDERGCDARLLRHEREGRSRPEAAGQARAQRQPHRPIPRRAARPTHREDAAHIIRSLGRLPAIEQSPRAFGDDMLREKDIAAVPSVGESALLLSDGERRATLTHP